MWGSFEILESYVGERVNKIRFVGNINREIRETREEIVSTYVLGEKGRKTREERRDQGELRFLQK